MGLAEDLLGGQETQNQPSSLNEDLLGGYTPPEPVFGVEDNGTWNDVVKGAQAGIESAPTYVAQHGEPTNPYEPTTMLGKASKFGTNLGATLPYYMTGAMIGAPVGAAVGPSFGVPPQAGAAGGATIGAFALGPIVEELGKQVRDRKFNYPDLVNKFGKEATTAALFHIIGGTAGELGNKIAGKWGDRIAKVLGEGSTLAFLQNPGSFPTAKELATTVGVLAGLGITNATLGKVIKLKKAGIDVNKLKDAVERGVVTVDEAKQIIEGKTPEGLNTIWQRMPQKMLQVNAEQGIPEAVAEVERRKAEATKKATEVKPKEEVVKEEGKVKKSLKRTRDGKYLGKAGKYKKLLGNERYYEVLKSLGIEKSNQVLDAQSKSLVLQALKKAHEELPKKVEQKPTEPENSGQKLTKAPDEPAYGQKKSKGNGKVKQEVKLKETGQVVTVERDAKEVFKELDDKVKRHEDVLSKLDKFKLCMGW